MDVVYLFRFVHDAFVPAVIDAVCIHIRTDRRALEQNQPEIIQRLIH